MRISQRTMTSAPRHPLITIAVGGLLAGALGPLCSCSDDDATATTAGSGGSTSVSTSSSASTDAGPAGTGGGGAATGSGGSGAGGDDGCPLYTTLCDGACIPTSVDPQNCGGCGVECTGDLACSSGVCSEECLPGQTACDNACVDVLTSDDHCGACGAPCPDGEGCSDGECVDALIDVDPPAMCADGGPPLHAEDGTPLSCQAATAFTWALCSCRDVQLSSDLLTDAYDSSEGPWSAPGALGAGVGANGRFQTSGPASISGTLWSADENGVGTSNELAVGVELHANGPYQSSSPGTVGTNAFVNGDVSTSQSLDVGGELHVPAGATVDDGVTYGTLVEGPVVVPPPCACEPDQLLDVSGIVAAHATNNDNELIGLDPAATVSPSDALRIDLPCGRYYLDSIGGSHDVTIVAHGHTALYVGGDVQLSQSLRITVDPGFALDVFIAGDLRASAGSSFGSPSYPAMTRVYVGGDGGFGMSAESLFGAFFWAGHGPVQTSGGTEIFGGVFAGDFAASADVRIHYDLAVQGLADTCDDPGGGGGGPGGDGCGSCSDCGNQACIDGECTSCTDSSQCCAPLVCVGGTCTVIPN